MEFSGWERQDFDVFDIPGLDLRMAALKERVRPKLAALGADFVPCLTQQTGRQTYAHVARHARRTVNPPADSWVAFSHDSRGYKQHPHYQIGLWNSHAFVTFGLIYESPARGLFASRLRSRAEEIVARIPAEFVWIPDHMSPAALPARDVDARRLVALADRLLQRQGELLCGLLLPQAQATAMTAAAFEQRVTDCFLTLRCLFGLTVDEEAVS